MKIWSVKIDGQPWDHNKSDYTQEQIDSAGVPLDEFLVASETSPGANYTDVTSIEMWAYEYKRLEKTYGFMREQIKTLASNKTSGFTDWDALTDKEKDIVCAYFCAPKALRLLHVTEDKDKEQWKTLVRQTKSFRENIIEAGREYVSDFLRDETMTYAESDQFYIDTEEMLDRYRMTDNRSFQAWLQDQPPYDQGNGFSSKSYYTVNRRDKLVDIFVNYNL